MFQLLSNKAFDKRILQIDYMFSYYVRKSFKRMLKKKYGTLSEIQVEFNSKVIISYCCKS